MAALVSRGSLLGDVGGDGAAPPARRRGRRMSVGGGPAPAAQPDVDYGYGDVTSAQQGIETQVPTAALDRYVHFHRNEVFLQPPPRHRYPAAI